MSRGHLFHHLCFYELPPGLSGRTVALGTVLLCITTVCAVATVTVGPCLLQSPAGPSSTRSMSCKVMQRAGRRGPGRRRSTAGPALSHPFTRRTSTSITGTTAFGDSGWFRNPWLRHTYLFPCCLTRLNVVVVLLSPQTELPSEELPVEVLLCPPQPRPKRSPHGDQSTLVLDLEQLRSS